ncbi:DUF742 domain-containing protein [Streptomyces sp. NPDC050538]|uniref:DUF742 domain-containing protein n=1 Tax=Streptomyces sp. NPDC050538 TaxID=3365627 RepID=UPI0037A0BDFA
MTRPRQDTPPSTPSGPAFVRSYYVTGGRTRARHVLRPETVLEAGTGRGGPGLAEGEYRQITQLCRTRRRSVAEVAGTVRLPLSTVRVLISDLVDARVLVLPVTTPYTPTDSPTGNRPSPQLLEAVRAGLALKWTDADVRAS